MIQGIVQFALNIYNTSKEGVIDYSITGTYKNGALINGVYNLVYDYSILVINPNITANALDRKNHKSNILDNVCFRFTHNSGLDITINSKRCCFRKTEKSIRLYDVESDTVCLIEEITLNDQLLGDFNYIYDEVNKNISVCNSFGASNVEIKDTENYNSGFTNIAHGEFSFSPMSENVEGSKTPQSDYQNDSNKSETYTLSEIKSDTKESSTTKEFSETKPNETKTESSNEWTTVKRTYTKKTQKEIEVKQDNESIQIDKLDIKSDNNSYDKCLDKSDNNSDDKCLDKSYNKCLDECFGNCDQKTKICNCVDLCKRKFCTFAHPNNFTNIKKLICPKIIVTGYPISYDSSKCTDFKCTFLHPDQVICKYVNCVDIKDVNGVKTCGHGAYRNIRPCYHHTDQAEIDVVIKGVINARNNPNKTWNPTYTIKEKNTKLH